MTKQEMIHFLRQSIDSDRETENLIDYYRDATRGKQLPDAQIKNELTKIGEGIPVQYVTGISFFYTSQFTITQDVLIPRPETEELVHWVNSDLKSISRSLNILDIGCGSGCIGLSVKKKFPNHNIILNDLSPNAIEVAQLNADNLNLKIQTCQDSILEPIELKTIDVDIIISNPPYILPSELNRMDGHVFKHEPHLALFVDNDDPLEFYKAIVKYGLEKKVQAIYFETSDIFHNDLLKWIGETAYKCESRNDLQGKPRMIKVY